MRGGTIDGARRSRWWLFWVLALAVSVILALAVATAPPGVAAIRLAIRVTARTSLLLFCTAFVASALAGWWPGRATRALLVHRRQIGLAFAWSHALHLAAIIVLARVDPVGFHASAVTRIFGGFAYVLIAAMAATSFDRSARWLGARRWRLLHVIGSYYVWLVFTNSYAGRAFRDAYYVPMLALLIAVMATRLAWAAQRRLTAPRSAVGA